MKIYCSDCKFMTNKKTRNGSYSCTKFKTNKIYPSYYKLFVDTIYRSCSEVNNNNDCPDYQPTKLKRLKDLFRSKSKK